MAKTITPLGLSRWVLLAYYFAYITFSGYATSAIPPLKALMRSANVLPELTTAAREAALVNITSFGFTTSLFGSLVMGMATDFIGPKITSILGQLLFILGYCFLLVWPQPSVLVMYIGSGCLGLSFMAIFISPLSVATLFPGNTTTILAVLGAAPDLSLLIPTGLNSLSNVLGLRTTIICYLSFLFGFAVVNVFTFPNRPFVADASAEDLEQSPIPIEDKETKTNQTGYATLSLGRQLLTVHFWLFTFLLALNQFRKLHFNQASAAIIEQAGAASKAATAQIATMVEAYSIALPFAVFPAVAMGVFTNSFGIIAGMCLQNLFAVLLYICSIIPSFSLQFCSIILYNLMSSYITGVCCAALATYYGFATLGTLQGIQCIFAVAATSLYPLWNMYVVSGASMLVSNIILLTLSVAAFVVPLYTYFKTPGEGLRIAKDGSPLLLPRLSAMSCDKRLQKSSIAGPAAIVYSTDQTRTVAESNVKYL